MFLDQKSAIWQRLSSLFASVCFDNVPVFHSWRELKWFQWSISLSKHSYTSLSGAKACGTATQQGLLRPWEETRCYWWMWEEQTDLEKAISGHGPSKSFFDWLADSEQVVMRVWMMEEWAGGSVTQAKSFRPHTRLPPSSNRVRWSRNPKRIPQITSQLVSHALISIINLFFFHAQNWHSEYVDSFLICEIELYFPQIDFSKNQLCTTPLTCFLHDYYTL